LSFLNGNDEEVPKILLERANEGRAKEVQNFPAIGALGFSGAG
jgi:hypothetical protein